MWYEHESKEDKLTRKIYWHATFSGLVASAVVLWGDWDKLFTWLMVYLLSLVLFSRLAD